MDKARIFLTLSLLAVLGACAFQPSSMERVYPKMYQNPPASILILPPINNSTAVEAKEYFACSLAEAIGRKGYYTLPVEAVFAVMRDEGLYDTETLDAVHLQNLKKYFGADAVLKTTINRWDKVWLGLGGNLTIEADYALLSTTSGETLWNVRSRIDVNLDSDSGNILGAIIESALKTAFEDYFPNSHQANLETMDRALPFGIHHPQHLSDATSYAPLLKEIEIEITK